MATKKATAAAKTFKRGMRVRFMRKNGAACRGTVKSTETQANGLWVHVLDDATKAVTRQRAVWLTEVPSKS